MLQNSELRQDPVSGDWILISTARGQRPHDFAVEKPIEKTSAKTCPFEHPERAGAGPLVASYPKNDAAKDNWLVKIINNKYPAVTHTHTKGKIKCKECAAVKLFKIGPYSAINGVGHHEVVITKDHNKDIWDLSHNEAKTLFKALADRYKAFIKEDGSISYVSMFHNIGPLAGASVYHPHYQIITLPVIPPDVGHSLAGSGRYKKRTGKCVHCYMIKWEKEQGSRIIFENEFAISFAPFVSRLPFETRVYPKRHNPYFEDTPANQIDDIITATQETVRKLHNALKPQYNLFIHTAPIKDKHKHEHYHWHIEILPKISKIAGFELGTGIDINIMDPDDAAKFIREAR
ncbi:MAG: DUF4921 family protein [Candidatus Colwellbacteria bacterium]|nr:DUF4921 family protein [Candidatus Colwellbacteria bacterium]